MFERFTHAARTAVVLAQEEARRQGSPAIEPLHLLHGVLIDTTSAPAVVLGRWGVDAAEVAKLGDAGPSSDAEALSALGIDLDEVRRRAEQEFGVGALEGLRGRRWRRTTKGHLAFASTSKAVLQQAVRAAAFYRHGEIGSAQLFLGLLTDEDIVLALHRLGVRASTAELIALVRERVDKAA